nr:MAG TPA: hypothetical protein [Caudoviricetes sp.]
MFVFFFISYKTGFYRLQCSSFFLSHIVTSSFLRGFLDGFFFSNNLLTDKKCLSFFYLS